MQVLATLFEDLSNSAAFWDILYAARYGLKMQKLP